MIQLQTAFYIIGIIFMVVYGLLLIGIVVLLFYMWKKISGFIDILTEKLDQVKYAASHPEEIASSMGEALAGTAINRIMRMFSKKSD